MRLQFVSDLHLETRPKETFDILLDGDQVAPALALLGDIAPLDHPNLRPFLEWCSERWEIIFYVPGVTEILTGFDRAATEEPSPVAIEANVKRLREICETYQNIQVLYRDAFFSEDGVILLGCSFWGCLANQTKVMRDLHRTDLDWVKRVVRRYPNPFCILSHFGPVPWVQDEDVIYEPADVPSVPEIELLLRKPIVAWAFGHHHGLVQSFKLWNTPTGETREITLVCNGLGKADRWGSRRAFAHGYRRDAVLRVDPRVYFEDRAI